MAHEIESPKLSFPDDNEAEGKISLAEMLQRENHH